jgi:hypothetical protein
MLRNLSFALICMSVAACGGAQGTQPHDMSAAQHEAAASQEDQSSTEHAQQYNPGSETRTQVCEPKRVCWTARVNPTDQHRADATQHEQLASKHRAAAKALRDAEASACVGIEEEDRDNSPFYFREDIASVQALNDDAGAAARGGKSYPTRQVGARVTFRAVPGLTAEWLQRTINCHIARAAVLGHDDPEMAYCPLTLKGIHATVTSTGDGFAVDVRSDDDATVKEIQRRVNGLAAR